MCRDRQTEPFLHALPHGPERARKSTRPHSSCAQFHTSKISSVILLWTAQALQLLCFCWVLLQKQTKSHVLNLFHCFVEQFILWCTLCSESIFLVKHFAWWRLTLLLISTALLQQNSITHDYFQGRFITILPFLQTILTLFWKCLIWKLSLLETVTDKSDCQTTSREKYTLRKCKWKWTLNDFVALSPGNVHRVPTEQEARRAPQSVWKLWRRDLSPVWNRSAVPQLRPSHLSLHRLRCPASHTKGLATENLLLHA